MNGSERSTVKARRFLRSILVGAVISGASTIAYINSERDMPFVAKIAVSTISLAAIPGYILSALVSGNIHDANLILTTLINCALYTAIALYLMIRKNRKR